MSLSLTLFLILVCMVSQGFFSGTEIAMVSADRLLLKGLAAKGSSRAKLVCWWMSHPAKLFSTTLIAINLSTVLASALATIYLITHYGEEYGPLAIVLVPFTLIFCEIIPKSLFQSHANAIVLRAVPALTVFSTIFFPAVWLYSQITNFLLGGVREYSGTEKPLTREELHLLIKSSTHPESDLRPIERTMIKKILKLAEKRVRHVQIPTTEMVAIPLHMTVEEAEHICDMTGYSRLPVYEERPYQFVGVLHDVELIDVEDGKTLQHLMHPPLFVPEEMHLNDLFLLFREKKEEMALVVDEFGGVSGLVTLNDIYEEVVGEIRDEMDLARQRHQVLGKNRFLVSGRLEVAEANDMLHLRIPMGDYSTIAGYLLWHLGRMPQTGDSIDIGAWCYTIRSVSPRAILEIEIARAQDL
jgi:CBS domain containing-hemolysin-like protein